MAAYDSPDCLAQLIDRLALPVDDTGAYLGQETSNPVLYRLLSEAEANVSDYLAVRVPSMLMTAPLLLTSSDGGYTYPIKDANGTSIFASGHLRVFVSTADIPLSPIVEGEDYTLEGDLLRVPNNRVWSFATGPYIQPINDTIALSASVNPTIPVRCRDAMIAYAAQQFCERGGKRDPAPHASKYAAELKELCLFYRTAVTPSNQQGFGAPLTRYGLRIRGGF